MYSSSLLSPMAASSTTKDHAIRPHESGLFLQRPMLTVNEPVGGFRLSIMTYNVLAQCLVRRKDFPTSGDAIRWKTRSNVLREEINHYDPDVICMQEVDFEAWNSFWYPFLFESGYSAVYYRNPNRRHGLAIVHKRALLEDVDTKEIQYDNVVVLEVPISKETGNVALLRRFRPKASSELGTAKPPISITVATTHMYWHPFAPYERTRQCLVLLLELQSFSAAVPDGDKSSFQFIAGDFNTQPFDAPYNALTQRPVEFHDVALHSLAQSIEHDWVSPVPEGKDPNPKSFESLESTQTQINILQMCFNSIPHRAISLYSVGYKHVHPENAGLDNPVGEPFFSNWAHAWQGLLDYIFVLGGPGNTSESSSTSVDDLQSGLRVRLLELLKLPTKEEMGELGQPQKGMYPSDHLCIMASLELL